MSKIKTLQSYKKLLPKKITVEVHKNKRDGFWAKVKELPHCYTQAKTPFELVKMINDAIYTYLEIPNKLRNKLGFYLPETIIKAFQKIEKEEVMRKRWELALQAMNQQAQLKKKVEIFSLAR